MWAVLRAQQGEDYEFSPPTRGDFRENNNHIAMFQCRENPKAIDPNALTEPYLNRVYSKLVANLMSPELILRKKAVVALIDYFGQKREHVASAIRSGAIPALVKTLHDENTEVRVNSCVALRAIVEHPTGQKQVLDSKLEGELKQACDDPQSEVVVEALRLLAAMDAHWNDSAGTLALINAGCIPMYIRKAKTGVDVVKAEALRALSKVYSVKEAFIKVLDAEAMPVLSSLLTNRSSAVLEHAANNIALLCFYSAGKRAAVREPATMRELITLLASPNAEVRAATSSAIMAITIDNDGKEQALQFGGVAQFEHRLREEHDEVVIVTVLKCICNVSENPQARVAMQGFVPRIKEILAAPGSSERLQNAARRAVSAITWKP
eukprot:TRINITY_DN3278_c0_g1_i1.p1 TRINITY_DN3278_c0_g1~~TRINITY_DN3278_c0_g1_i1.p1  ORF type:complete len:379 (-),score=66.85 TRINITY_DN3278_c0_g1_i1:15-1151(-)